MNSWARLTSFLCTFQFSLSLSIPELSFFAPATFIPLHEAMFESDDLPKSRMLSLSDLR